MFYQLAILARKVRSPRKKGRKKERKRKRKKEIKIERRKEKKNKDNPLQSRAVVKTIRPKD